ncbi:LacI family DNA-binding transcriptional regulator [Faecalibacterium prausnitzii]|uniref:LacI family DNA-binding transcriptional regulator n=1 Tax=Faecalibacterium prausnitzii TaxID=853 RepID=UPI00268C1D4B
MATKVTIQDIANELQLSRNTVSKAINNTGVLADATREKILRKAAEMGYKQFAYLPLFQEDTAKAAEHSILPSDKREIAMLTTQVISEARSMVSMNSLVSMVTRVRLSAGITLR